MRPDSSARSTIALPASPTTPGGKPAQRSDWVTLGRLLPYLWQYKWRVVIALALCLDPAVVIADEPTTALDVSVQAQILELLRRMCRARGTAIVLITHDMGVIANTADRVAVLYSGRIVEIGPVEEMVLRPRHPYSAGLMAAIPRLGARERRLRQIPGAMPGPGQRPEGCAFHTRCRYADAACVKAVPPLEETDGHLVRCIHADALREQAA